MDSPGCRDGFTLVEVLIVVVIMAVLAGTVITEFSSAAESAKESSVKMNLSTMRAQIERYRMNHPAYPAIVDNDLPQLIGTTNRAGAIGTPGPDFPYGPYIQFELPENAFDRSNKVTPVAQQGSKPTAPVGNLGGWQYDVSTGNIWPNHPDYYSHLENLEAELP